MLKTQQKLNAENLNFIKMKHLKTKLLVIFSITFIGLTSFLSCETENSTEITDIETELSTH